MKGHLRARPRLPPPVSVSPPTPQQPRGTPAPTSGDPSPSPRPSRPPAPTPGTRPRPFPLKHWRARLRQHHHKPRPPHLSPPRNKPHPFLPARQGTGLTFTWILLPPHRSEPQPAQAPPTVQPSLRRAPRGQLGCVWPRRSSQTWTFCTGPASRLPACSGAGAKPHPPQDTSQVRTGGRV